MRKRESASERRQASSPSYKHRFGRAEAYSASSLQPSVGSLRCLRASPKKSCRGRKIATSVHDGMREVNTTPGLLQHLWQNPSASNKRITFQRRKLLDGAQAVYHLSGSNTQRFILDDRKQTLNTRWKIQQLRVTIINTYYFAQRPPEAVFSSEPCERAKRGDGAGERRPRRQRR